MYSSASAYAADVMTLLPTESSAVDCTIVITVNKCKNVYESNYDPMTILCGAISFALGIIITMSRNILTIGKPSSSYHDHENFTIVSKILRDPIIFNRCRFRNLTNSKIGDNSLVISPAGMHSSVRLCD